MSKTRRSNTGISHKGVIKQCQGCVDGECIVQQMMLAAAAAKEAQRGFKRTPLSVFTLTFHIEYWRQYRNVS